MATKKKFKKMLKQLVNTMPVVMERTHEDHIVKGTELIEQGYGNDHEIDPEKTYIQPMPVLLARNHENRLKAAYKNHGRSGISNYVREVKSIVHDNINAS